MENADEFFGIEADPSFRLDDNADVPIQFDFLHQPVDSCSWPSPFRTYPTQPPHRTLLSHNWQYRSTTDSVTLFGIPHLSLNDPSPFESASLPQDPTRISCAPVHPRTDVDLSECFQFVNDTMEHKKNTPPSRNVSVDISTSVQQPLRSSPKTLRTEPALPADPNAATRAAAIAAAAIDPGRGVPGRFKCQFGGCSLTFDRRYNLKTHYRKHTDERPYKCKEPGCKKSYRWRSSAHHHKTAHEVAKTKISKAMYSLPTLTPKNIKPALPSSGVPMSPRLKQSTQGRMPVEQERRPDIPPNDFGRTVNMNLDLLFNDHESSS